jgi:hypothetical protein
LLNANERKSFKMNRFKNNTELSNTKSGKEILRKAAEDETYRPTVFEVKQIDFK